MITILPWTVQSCLIHYSSLVKTVLLSLVYDYHLLEIERFVVLFSLVNLISFMSRHKCYKFSDMRKVKEKIERRTTGAKDFYSLENLIKPRKS